MKRLNGVYKNARNFVCTSAKNIQRRRMKVLESQTVSNRPLATESRLHAVPPAVIGASEAYNQLPAGVESRQPDRGHHRFGAAHMKRHFVQFRNGFQKVDVFCNHRMQGAQNRAKVLNSFPALFHPFLVKVEPGDVESVRTADIEVPIP